MRQELIPCVVCGAMSEYVGIGRKPKFCINCTPSKNRSTRVRQVEERTRLVSIAEGATHDLANAGLGAPNAEESAAWIASAVELMAVGLNVTEDIRRAAAIVGLDPERPDLADLATQARTECKALFERKPAAVGQIINTALLLAMIRLRNSMATLPVTTIANAAKAMAQTMEMIQGSAGPAYTELKIMIQGPEGEQDLTQKGG